MTHLINLNISDQRRNEEEKEKGKRYKGQLLSTLNTCGVLLQYYFFTYASCFEQNEGFEQENLVDAKQRMHKLLDDAFALITPKLDEYVYWVFRNVWLIY